MEKYALIWTTDIGYMPGTNACLNAMEYYGFDKSIDVFIRYWGDYRDLGEDYLSQWPNVHWSNIDGSFRPGMGSYWYMVFDDYHYSLKYLQSYDVVSFWGADMCILNDFSYFFEVCHKIDNIIIGTNEHTDVDMYCQMSPEWPYGHTWTVPYTDSPLFVPKSKMDLIQLTLDFQFREGAMVDRMDGLNYAMRDLNHHPFTTPGNLWIFNVPQWIALKDGGRYVFNCNQRMFSFHRRYWNVNYLQNYIRGLGNIADHNAMLFNRKYNFFNTQCRVKWTEGLEVWDGKKLGEA